jgi:hypothetical protein
VTATNQKALEINLDKSKYGAFIEIGAGQEVARWFFRVGGASGTIAKTMSAYDMTVSDAIYGPCERYVSKPRLQSMLTREYDLLLERLEPKRGSDTRFFVFADTVAAKSFSRKEDAHGWLGVRFQTEPKGPISQVIIHVRLLDPENLQEQEALGIIGVNLIHAAMFHHDSAETILESLLDNLTIDRVEIDMIEFSGEAFKHIDNRVMALCLVQKGMTKATMFLANGEVVQPADILHKKCILVERGSFRPITKVTLDMLECAKSMFVQEPDVEGSEILVIMEMTLKNLLDQGKIDYQDFLDRVDTLASLGKTVLISNFGEYHRLAAYFFRYTKKMIGIVMGVPTLKEIFDERYYADLEGGILESFGRLFKNKLKLFIYPLLEKDSMALITADNLVVQNHLKHLYSYLIENNFIESIRGYDSKCLSIFSRDVLDKIRRCDNSWETMVPESVIEIIKSRGFFNHKLTN